MLQLEPVNGWLVRAEHAARVVAPPYDALAPAERSELAASDRDSYLGALPTGGVLDGPELARCRAHLDDLQARSRFAALAAPSLLVLAITRRGRTSVAVLGDVDVAAYGDGRIRGHEATRDDRVAHLARYLDEVGVASSPVAVAHRPDRAVTAATDAVRRAPPTVAFTDPARGERWEAWAVEDRTARAALTEAVAGVGDGHVADGHHRAAAVASHAAGHRLPAGHAGRRVVTALFPDDHLEVWPFHRAVDVASPPWGVEALLDGDTSPLTAAGFTVRMLEPGPQPPWYVPRPGHWHLGADGHWWEVTPAGGRADRTTATRIGGAGLDIERVDVLLAALGIDPAEARPVAPTTPAALTGAGTLALALHPPAWRQVRAVADAGGTLPAKTTYLTPKLRSGLLVVPRPPAGS